MPFRFLKKSNCPLEVIDEKKSERLHPNHGVDVRTMEVDDLGDTIASRTLKKIIQSLAAERSRKAGNG